MALLCEVFRGWVPADLENMVSFRGRASFLQACGPAAYVAGLVGKEARWRDTVLEVWEAMPSSEPAGWLPNACVYFCSCFCSCLLIFYVTSAAICAQHFVFVLAAMFTMNFAAREAVAMRRRLAAREIRILVRLAPLGWCQLRVPRGYTILRIIDVLSTCPLLHAHGAAVVHVEFNGQVLAEGRTLADYNITDGSTVNVVLRAIR